MLICSDCEDYELCKLGNYKNLLINQDHPVSTDNVFEAIAKVSKKDGEGVTFDDERYMSFPNKVRMLYKIAANAIAKKRQKELEKKANGAK